MTGPRITEVSLSLAHFIASAGSNPAFYRISLIAPPFPESWRTVDSGLRFPSVQVTYLMTVIQFFGRPSTLPLTNQLQPSTSKTDKKTFEIFQKIFGHKKASASTLETESIFQYTKSVINAKTAAPDYSDATVKYLQMCVILGAFCRLRHRLAYAWHTLAYSPAFLYHNHAEIPANTANFRTFFFSPTASLSGTAAHRG